MREVELGGAIHSKGVLILSGFLAQHYLIDKHLILSARVVFEQSYGEIDGDSASVAELCALLSAIGGLPVQQRFAVTGSIDQYGNVQAVGAINEKIEGFFEICRERGLNGKHGVLIPKSNEKNLMLKDEVIEAVKTGKFSIYAVKNIDEGIEILTRLKAGKRLASGKFIKDSINFRVDKKIEEFTNKLSELSKLNSENKKEA